VNQSSPHPTIDRRFRGFLPVVVDVETAGFNAATDALLEIAAIVIEMDAEGFLHPPFRMALPEREALQRIFTPVRQAVKKHNCRRAILVGHNAFFDLGFLNAAVERTGLKRNPFHPFSTFDTVSLAGLAYGQTVLARAVAEAGIEWDSREAHSALYDTEKTAELFCAVVNRWQQLTQLEKQLCAVAEASPSPARPSE